MTKHQKIYLVVGVVLLMSAVGYYLYWTRGGRALRRRNQGAKIVTFPPLFVQDQDLPDKGDGRDEKDMSRALGAENPAAFLFKDTIQEDDEKIVPLAGNQKSPFPLKLGSEGKEVEQLQIYLMKKAGGFEADQLDGTFGFYTLERLKKHCGRDQMSERNFYKRRIDQERTYKYKISC